MVNGAIKTRSCFHEMEGAEESGARAGREMKSEAIKLRAAPNEVIVNKILSQVGRRTGGRPWSCRNRKETRAPIQSLIVGSSMNWPRRWLG